MEKIVRREGIGDVLANGVYWAARQIGNGAEAYDHNTIKKFEQVPIKLGMINYPYFLMYATGEKMNITQIEGSYPQSAQPIWKSEKSLSKVGTRLLNDSKNGFWNGSRVNIHAIEASVNICDWNETMHYVDDAIGTCAFLSSFRGQFGGRPPYHIYNLPEILSHWRPALNLDSDGLWKIAARNRNLVRAINVRRGLRRSDETPPADHWKKRDPETEQKAP